ncbi:MAG TPA: twin-arginine translocation signal domain-containing protein [Acidimicrobiales bacterium]|nr:twin-arginine translocation signal domain-containing protein [Acidimicrobiales bacterium]
MRRRRFLQASAATVAGAGLGACGDDAAPTPDEGQVLGTVDEVRSAIAEWGGPSGPHCV